MSESIAADGGSGASPRGGELTIAIDPEGFLGGAAAGHLTRAEQLFDGITGQGARLPSERRYQARERSLAEGVEVHAGLPQKNEALLDGTSTASGFICEEAVKSAGRKGM